MSEREQDLRPEIEAVWRLPDPDLPAQEACGTSYQLN